MIVLAETVADEATTAPLPLYFLSVCVWVQMKDLKGEMKMGEVGTDGGGLSFARKCVKGG